MNQAMMKTNADYSFANDDLTLSEALADPMIRAVMRADKVTTSEFKMLMLSAANALRQPVPPATDGARQHATRLLAAPKRRLLAMVHPLAAGSAGHCAACY